MSNYFKSADNLLLQEYFELKVKLSELQVTRGYCSRIFHNTDDVDKEIKETKISIVETINMFDLFQLTQIIYMGLNIDYDGLVAEGVIR